MDYLLLLLLALLLWAILIYNKLVRDKNRVLAAWSDIDVQLKRRHDLIPKLVQAVDAYAHYERATLDEITRLRSTAEQTADPLEKSRVESGLTGRVRELLAVAEAYPELKASAQYLNLLQQLSDVEQTIQYARRYYNGCVRDFNVRIDSFPDLLVARAFSFAPAAFFELENAVDPTPTEGKP